ncbi:MAG: hypothetical protein COB15_00045 [Flavobacteriales bacterium]|nr:MAG: hypothetical protein COB15_00045 [Flavobacteriales bacterium]
MKDIDNIEDWYRDELSNYNVEPDKNLWKSLSEELDASTPLTDETISEWYKKEVTKLEERPDYTVWEKLSTRLDTVSVWDKLAISLNRYDQLIWWKNIAIRGTAVFLLLFGSYLAYDNYSTNNKQIASNITTLKKNTVKSNNASSLTNTPNKSTTTYEAAFLNDTKNESSTTNQADKNVASKKDNTALSANSNDLKTISNNKTNLTPEEKIAATLQNAKESVNPTKPNKRSRSKENTSYTYIKKIQEFYSSIYKDKLDELKSETERNINTNITHKKLSEKDIARMYVSGEYLVKKDNNKIVFNSKRFSSYSMFGIYTRRIYVGFNAGVKKQGMFTSLKENSPLSEYNQNTLLDFGYNFGGTVGFIVSDKLNMETNINLNSTSGYKREFDREGILYQENLNLNYTSISLLAKKMNTKSTFDNKVYSTNLIGGIYASYLRSAVSYVNGASKKLDDYTKTDFGIVLGIEQDRYITKTLVITPGIRYNQGLTNNAKDSSPFSASRNFSFEFNLGVKYIFLKKGK